MEDAFIWERQAHFSAQMLASLRELNHRFIDLAAAHAADWSQPGHRKLPGESGLQLAALSPAQREAAASCPYALFDLRFHDHAHWRASLCGSAVWRVADEAWTGQATTVQARPPEARTPEARTLEARSPEARSPEARSAEARVDDETAAFVRLALFYAWHVAATPRLGAPLWIGMAEPTAVAFRAVTLNRVAALVPAEARHLSARWCASGYYWSALATAAARRDDAQLRRVQLFGLQLAAAALLS
ncbi:MAG TPA: hypothetical protein VME42_11165 [Steroidobacteraceae bacterium]|nr:hypothetical protein [Steroidobacteraceae bacterium]